MGGVAILGASGGLGQAVAQRLARRLPLSLGFHRNEAKAVQLAQDIAGGGGRAAVGAVDIRDGESVRGFIRQAAERWGGLDGIVSVTGPAIPLCALADVADADFRRIIETDVVGSFNVLKQGIAALSGGGSIVLFLTTAVLRTLENDGMSGVPKTAVAGLLRQAAREAGPRQVRCNGVAPGVIDAGIVHSAFAVDDVARSVIASCMRQTPMGRMGTPQEVAALVDFLLSADAAYISGQIIAVDGGYSA